MAGPASNPSSVVCAVNNKIEREAIDKLAKDRLDKGGRRWVDR